jgi:UDP-glucose 4-epimerase
VNDFRTRSVLVLGGLGFIGGRLSDRLLTMGARLTIVTPSRARHVETAVGFEARGARIVEADVRDSAAMSTAVAEQNVIFNLAGQSGAVRSMEDPWTDLDVNCRGNLSLLEALRAVNRDAKVVFAGSRLEYGHPATLPVTEDFAQEPLCLHAIHKITVEHYLRLYARLFGIRYTIARLTNPYGPGQPRERTTYGVVNRMIHLALAGETLPVYGDGAQRRDYIYIDDAVEALLALGGSGQSDGRAYNVGTGVGTRLMDMALLIVRCAGGGRIESADWPPLAHQIETGDFIADIARIRADLEWQPAVPLEEGLRRTVAFYRVHVGS